MNDLVACLVLGFNINLLLTAFEPSNSMLVTVSWYFYTTVVFTAMLNYGLLIWQQLYHSDDEASFWETISNYYFLAENKDNNSALLDLPGSFPADMPQGVGQEEYRLPSLHGSFPTDNNTSQANDGSQHTSLEGMDVAAQQTVEPCHRSFPHLVSFNLLLHHSRSLMNALTHEVWHMAARPTKVRFHISMVKERAGYLLSRPHGQNQQPVQTRRESNSTAVENATTEPDKEADNTNPNHQPSEILAIEHQHIVQGENSSHSDQQFAGSDSGYASSNDGVAEQPEQDMHSDSADHGQSHTEQQRDPSASAGQVAYESMEEGDENQEVNENGNAEGSSNKNGNGDGDGDGGDDDQDKDYDADDEDQDSDPDSDSDSEADSEDDDEESSSDEDADNLGQEDDTGMVQRQRQRQRQREVGEAEAEAQPDPVQYRYVHTDQHGRRLAWDYTNIPTRFDLDSSTPPPRSSTAFQVWARQFRRAARRAPQRQ